MSFWLDEDDNSYTGAGLDFGASQQNHIARQSQGTCFSQETIDRITTDEHNNSFVCEQCGGTEFYVDDATNRTVCTSCYTESQETTQADMDYDDVIGLAAKTSTGAVRRHTAGRGRQRQRTMAQRLEDLTELDSSIPLPNLKICLLGFQRVLSECTKRLARLMNLSFRNTQIVLDTVRMLWLNYLKSWSDGAEHYGSLHPEIRFSLRDYFFRNPKHRAMIVRRVTYDALQKFKNETNEETFMDDTGQVKRGQQTDNNPRVYKKAKKEDLEDDDDEIFEDDELSFIPAGSSAKRSRPIVQIVFSHTKGKERTYRDVAMYVTPSMNMAAALLWLAVYQSGITSSQICHWISNGSLPLLNSYSLLTLSQQHALRPIQYFFQEPNPLTLTALENIATQLAVACRMKNQPDLLMKTKSLVGIRFVTADSAPRVAAQLAVDLNLGQAVLNRALLWMGVLPLSNNQHQHDSDDSEEATSVTTEKNQVWDKAHPEKLTNVEDVLALLAVACFVDPDWRHWSFARPSNKEVNEAKMDCFVPWNPEQLQYLGNGTAFAKYIDFVETFVFDKKSAAPDFTSLLRLGSLAVDDTSILYETTMKEKNFDYEHEHINLEPIQPCPYLAGVNHIRPSSEPCTSKRNEFDRYKVYYANVRTYDEVNAPQKLFIEFMAYATRVEVQKIQLALDKLLATNEKKQKK